MSIIINRNLEVKKIQSELDSIIVPGHESDCLSPVHGVRLRIVWIPEVGKPMINPGRGFICADDLDTANTKPLKI